MNLAQNRAQKCKLLTILELFSWTRKIAASLPSAAAPAAAWHSAGKTSSDLPITNFTDGPRPSVRESA